LVTLCATLEDKIFIFPQNSRVTARRIRAYNRQLRRFLYPQKLAKLHQATRERVGSSNLAFIFCV